VVGQTSHIYYYYILGGEAGIKLYCLVNRGTRVLTTCPGLLLAVHQAGVEPVTLRSPIRHATLKPPSHTLKVDLRYLWYLLTEFDQTFTTNRHWGIGKDQHIKLWGSKGQGHDGIKCARKCIFRHCSCHLLVEA